MKELGQSILLLSHSCEILYICNNALYMDKVGNYKVEGWPIRVEIVRVQTLVKVVIEILKGGLYLVATPSRRCWIKDTLTDP